MKASRLAVLLLAVLGQSAAVPYTLIIDAGSSGTRIYAYKWQPRDGQLPEIAAVPPSAASDKVPRKAKAGMYERVETQPGLSHYVRDLPGLASKALQPLLIWAKAVVPTSQWGQTPVFLLATAGLRKLSVIDQEQLLNTARTILANSGFRSRPSWVRIISGSEEGAYGWVAANYLRGTLHLGPTPATHTATSHPATATTSATTAATTTGTATGTQGASAGTKAVTDSSAGSTAGSVTAAGKVTQVTRVTQGETDVSTASLLPPLDGLLSTLDLGGSSLEVTTLHHATIATPPHLTDTLDPNPHTHHIPHTTHTDTGSVSGSSEGGGGAEHVAIQDVVVGGLHYYLATRTYKGFGLTDTFDRSVALLIQEQQDKASLLALVGATPQTTGSHTPHTTNSDTHTPSDATPVPTDSTTHTDTHTATHDPTQSQRRQYNQSDIAHGNDNDKVVSIIRKELIAGSTVQQSSADTARTGQEGGRGGGRVSGALAVGHRSADTDTHAALSMARRLLAVIQHAASQLTTAQQHTHSDDDTQHHTYSAGVQQRQYNTLVVGHTWAQGGSRALLRAGAFVTSSTPQSDATTTAVLSGAIQTGRRSGSVPGQQVTSQSGVAAVVKGLQVTTGALQETGTGETGVLMTVPHPCLLQGYNETYTRIHSFDIARHVSKVRLVGAPDPLACRQLAMTLVQHTLQPCAAPTTNPTTTPTITTDHAATGAHGPHTGSQQDSTGRGTGGAIRRGGMEDTTHAKAGVVGGRVTDHAVAGSRDVSARRGAQAVQSDAVQSHAATGANVATSGGGGGGGSSGVNAVATHTSTSGTTSALGCAASMRTKPIRGSVLALTGFYVVWRFFLGADTARAGDPARLRAAAAAACGRPWHAMRADQGHQVNAEKYCLWSQYVVELLGPEGLNVPPAHLGIGSGDIGWPLGAVLSEVSKEIPELFSPLLATQHTRARTQQNPSPSSQTADTGSIARGARLVLVVGLIAAVCAVALSWWRAAWRRGATARMLLPVTSPFVKRYVKGSNNSLAGLIRLPLMRE